MPYTEQTPWIPRREATICTWKIDYNRGYIGNMNTSLLTDFVCLSNRQLSDYAEMLKVCGFTGAQVTDIVAAWRASGSWEAVHDRYKVFADELHKRGMTFTLWVWAANFTGHGWTDGEVAYQNADPTQPAWKDPRVWAAFNKYYDIYADMAPYTDRVIAHFFDPGELRDMESILTFTRLLADKFRAVNPAVKVGIDTWGAPADYPDRLVEAGMEDIMLMELPFLPTWRAEGKRAAFRQGVKALGVELGSWGWYTCDYEIDQIALMTVNNRVISHVFNETRRQADHVLTPTYWSELDSYHLLNFFSLYAAGHLLINPEADPDTLLRESARLMTGESHPEDAARLVSVLEVIRDARSGDRWETYWHGEGDYILVRGDYTPILPRAEEAITHLEHLIAQPEPTDGMVFPIPRKTLYRLMLPHLHQIRQFAALRVELDGIKAQAKAGADRDTLQAKVNALDFEIPEYNCIIGLWGQPEARIGYSLISDFCKKHGLTTPPVSGATRHACKRRLVDFFRVCQRDADQPVWVDHRSYEGGLPFGGEPGIGLMDELVAEGVLVRREDGFCCLADWCHYRFDFSI
jgi:hypothetical protein